MLLNKNIFVLKCNKISNFLTITLILIVTVYSYNKRFLLKTLKVKFREKRLKLTKIYQDFYLKTLTNNTIVYFTRNIYTASLFPQMQKKVMSNLKTK